MKKIYRNNGYNDVGYDIGYSIGEALGNIWSDNYNQRGIEKAQQAMDEKLNGVSSELPEMPATTVNGIPSDELYRQAVDSGAISMGTPTNGELIFNGQNINAAQINTPQKYLTQEIQESKQQPIQNTQTPTVSQPAIQSVQIPTQTVAGGVNDTLQQATPQRDLKAEKLDYIANKYATRDNPEDDKRSVNLMTVWGKSALDRSAYSKNLLTDKAKVKADMFAEARRAGRPQYQIEEAWSRIEPEVDARIKSDKEKAAYGYIDILNSQIQRGELDNANITLAKISELNPAIGNAIENKMKRAWDRHDMQYNLDQKADYLINNFGYDSKTAKNIAAFGNIYDPVEQARRQKEKENRDYQLRLSRANGGDSGGRKSYEVTPKEMRDQYNFNREIIELYETDPQNSGITEATYNDAVRGNRTISKRLNSDYVGTSFNDYKAAIDEAYSKGVSSQRMIDIINDNESLSGTEKLELVKYIENR